MQSISVFDPRQPERSIFGELEFLGGLVLTSRHEDFGGFSGFRWLDLSGRFIAVTDKARVLTGRLGRTGTLPSGISDTWVTRIKASSGRTITGANDKDAEAIEAFGNLFAVGYERNDRVGFFRLKDRTLVADPEAAFVDLNHLGFPENRGPEALARHPGTDELLVFAEHALDENGHHRGVLLGKGKPARELRVTLKDGYSITDADFLPGGDLLILERYYNPFTGVFIRLRRIKAEALFTVPVLDGSVLLEAGPRTEIDNMEGLAVSEMSDGSARVTLISDDNFSRRQRTVLLEFRLLN